MSKNRKNRTSLFKNVSAKVIKNLFLELRPAVYLYGSRATPTNPSIR
jgi:hypothetical protein